MSRKRTRRRTSERVASTSVPVVEDGFIRPRGKYDQPGKADDDLIEAMLRFVRDSGVASLIARWRAEDREREEKGPGGRSAFADDDVVIALMLALAAGSYGQNCRDMTALVLHGISPRARVALGLDLRGISDDGVYHRLRRSYHRTLSVLDPHQGPRRHRLTKANFAALEAEVDAARRDERHERLLTVSNLLVQQSWQSLPRDVRRRWKGNAVVDATFYPAYGRSGTTHRSDYVGIEPHAGWYRRDGEHGVSEADLAKAAKGQMKKLGKIHWGWELTLFAACANDPLRVSTFPQLIVGVAMDRPGVSPGRVATSALLQMHASGMPAGLLAGDRAYGTNPKPEDFQEPVRAMGYQLIADLQDHEIARTSAVQGGILLEGSVYCPSIMSYPELVTATRDYRKGDPAKGGERISWSEWTARIEQRSKFLAHRNGLPRPDGSVRLRCPAAGPSPTVKCPLRPRDLGDKVTGLWPILRQQLPAESERGSFCHNTSGDVTVEPRDNFAKYAQDVQFGSDRWRAAYSSMRQTIESFNRYVKDSSGVAISSPDRRRVRGFASAFLLAATMIVAANRRKINRWLSDQPKLDHRGRGPLKESKSRLRDATYGAERPKPWVNTRPLAPDRPPPGPPDPDDWVGDPAA